MGIGLFRHQTTNVFPVVDKIRIDRDLNMFNENPLSLHVRKRQGPDILRRYKYFMKFFLHTG